MSNELHWQRSLRPRQPATAAAKGGADCAPSGAEVERTAAGGDVDAAQSWPAGHRRDRRDTLGAGRVPPAGLLLARPLLLVIFLMLGAVAGGALSGGGGFKAKAVLHFTTPGTDSTLVKQTGQTLALTAISENVLSAVEKAAKAPNGSLSGNVSAEWQSDTELVTVTATSPSAAAAQMQANAVADAVVSMTNSDVNQQLTAARAQFNRILNSEKLDAAGAESARQNQLGQALAAREDEIASASGSITVRDRADGSSVAGLTRTLGAAIGAVAGLLLGGLVSLLLGLRGLRAFSERTLRNLVPDAAVSSPSRAAQLAGQLIESRKGFLAIVVMEGADEHGLAFSHDVADFLRVNGRLIREVSPAEVQDRQATFDLLQYDHRTDVRGSMHVDLVVAVIPAGSVACQMLEGQSNLRAVVMMRRGSTPVLSALRTMQAFERAEPILILAR